uniref:Uncharacterized protein n=1 Tax=Vitis vinifera TaxID=29760 RepID=F6H3D3_VITVI
MFGTPTTSRLQQHPSPKPDSNNHIFSGASTGQPPVYFTFANCRG